MGARLTKYFLQSGIVLMPPPPREAHSNNPRAGQSDALTRNRPVPDGPRESYRSTVRLEPVRLDEEGFTTINPSGVDNRELGALTARSSAS